MLSDIKMSEAELQSCVIDLAQILKWRVAHFRPAMTKAGNWVTPVAADGKGFPDLVLVRDGVVMFVELKSAAGRLSDEQQDWLADLNAFTSGKLDAHTFIWRPEQWQDGTIERTLR